MPLVSAGQQVRYQSWTYPSPPCLAQIGFPLSARGAASVALNGVPHDSCPAPRCSVLCQCRHAVNHGPRANAPGLSRRDFPRSSHVRAITCVTARAQHSLPSLQRCAMPPRASSGRIGSEPVDRGPMEKYVPAPPRRDLVQHARVELMLPVDGLYRAITPDCRRGPRRPIRHQSLRGEIEHGRRRRRSRSRSCVPVLVLCSWPTSSLKARIS